MDRDFYIFVVLFLTIYWTYFIVRRARAFGARLRLLRRPTFWREFWDVEWDTRTCLAGVISRSDTARVGCTARVNYRNCNNSIIPECDA